MTMPEEINTPPTATDRPPKPPRKKRSASQFIALMNNLSVGDDAMKQVAEGATLKQVRAELAANSVVGLVVIACVRERLTIATETVTKTTIKAAKA